MHSAVAFPAMPERIPALRHGDGFATIGTILADYRRLAREGRRIGMSGRWWITMAKLAIRQHREGILS